MSAAGSESRDPRARLAVLAVALGACAYLAGTLAAPLVEAAGRPGGSLLRAVYAPVCHQLPERSLHLAGGAQAVCARCAGLYAGGVLGLIAGALWLVGTGRRRPHPWWLAAAAAPTFLDALLPRFGFPALDNLPRLVVALPAGAMPGLFLALAVAELCSSDRRPCAPRPARSLSLLEEADG
jgi:uncharacterized membrane protein